MNQMRKLRIVVMPAVAILFCAVASAQNLAGDWLGNLHVGGGTLRLLFHFSQGADGALTGTVDSLDQDAPGIPISSITFKDGKLTLASKAVNGTFEGKLSGDA